MSCTTLLNDEEQAVQSTSTTKSFQPLTGWVPCTGMTLARVRYRVNNRSGGLKVQPAFQLARIRVDQPRDTIVSFGTEVAANGFWVAERDLTSGTNNYEKTPNNMFARFGAMYRATTAGVRGAGQVGLQVSFESCGSFLSRTGMLAFDSFTSSSTWKYTVITQMVPTVGIAKIKLSILWSGLAGTASHGLFLRTASADRNGVADFSAWTLVQSDQVTVSDGEYFLASSDASADISSDLSGKMWVQFALGFRSTGVSTAEALVQLAAEP